MKMWTSLLLLLLLLAGTAALMVDSANKEAAVTNSNRPPCCPGGPLPHSAPGNIKKCRIQKKRASCPTVSYVVQTTSGGKRWFCISKDSDWLKKQLNKRSINCGYVSGGKTVPTNFRKFPGRF